MRLVQGTTLGSYEIVSLLGAGGMGEVYRARDPRLGRGVAIKVLPDETARDAERVARFEREARALAALNHPNVATLHGFETDGDRRFLVMELVEGEDLAARIERGAIPVDEAIPLFLQIAEGLEAAHEKGILHRDLKPANLKLGRDGRVKILDFGLAKAMADEHSAVGAAGGAGSLGDFTHSPTLTAQATRAGTLLGTAAYMSPEQARGLPADPRADLWAFGCCFYEALTARRPFTGEDAPQMLAAVLKDTPDWSALPDDLPHNLAVLLRRCLEKNRRARVQSAGDLRIELQESLAPPPALASTAALEAAGLDERQRSSARRAWRLTGLFAAVAAVLAAALTWLLVSKTEPPPLAESVTHVPVALPEGGGIHYNFFAPPLAISPDGRRIAWAGFDEEGGVLWLQDLDRPDGARLVRGAREVYGPFFSPDGANLGYLGDGIEVVSLSGGDPRSVGGGISLVAGGAIWIDDWVYYVDDTVGISRAHASGAGVAEPITQPGPSDDHSSPRPLPGGEHVLHTVWTRGATLPNVVVTAVASGEQTVLFEGAFAPRYLPSGHLLVAQQDVLLGMTLDLATFEVGPAVPVLEGLVTDTGEGIAAFAVSDSGTLVYFTGALERERWLVRLTPGEEPERLNARPVDFDNAGLAVSRDGRRVALSRNDGDLWIFDLETRELETRVTTDPAGDWNPVWGPDDQALTYASMRGGGWTAYSRRADGLGPETLLIEERRAQKWPQSWSPDGKTLLFVQADPETQNDLWVVPASRPAAAEVFLRTEFIEHSPAFSPDGRWVAYMSNESGTAEIYVTSYPDQNVKRKVSRGGGFRARWGKDAKRLYYSSWGGRVMMVEALDSQWSPSPPRPFVAGVEVLNWDLTPDERSVIALERRPPPRLHLVQNWLAELERLVPRR